MTQQEIFLKAADLLARDGWCQGSYYDENGGRCAAGAITDACGGVRPTEAARACALASQLCGDSLSTWNDTYGRTKEEVIALFQRCAEASA